MSSGAIKPRNLSRRRKAYYDLMRVGGYVCTRDKCAVGIALANIYIYIFARINGRVPLLTRYTERLISAQIHEEKKSSFFCFSHGFFFLCTVAQ